jgi:predicted nucleotidyltransferase
VTDDRQLPPSVEGAAVAFAHQLRERFGDQVLLVRVFGSYARGEAHEDSDVDVFVVLEQFDRERWAEVIDIATDTGLPRDLLLSPTVFDRATWELWRSHERALVMDVEREGVPV